MSALEKIKEEDSIIRKMVNLYSVKLIITKKNEEPIIEKEEKDVVIKKDWKEKYEIINEIGKS